MQIFLLLFLILLPSLATGQAGAAERHASTTKVTASRAERPPSGGWQRSAKERQKLNRLLRHAQQLQGMPYRWGGASERTGFDCSGLLVYLFRQDAGMELPRSTHGMIRQRHRQVSRQALKPGDAVFFSHNGSQRASHVGLYLGDGRFIHAPSTGKTVRIDSLDNGYWNRHYRTARRFRTL
ncbi:C40 family peptidase [Pseudomonas knackmussii]|uniref:C40 family peptidase n=1 Tax=Pseudomonas knackmussii TaxID=65741 RepID=UPI003F4A468B